MKVYKIYLILSMTMGGTPQTPRLARTLPTCPHHPSHHDSISHLPPTTTPLTSVHA